MFSYRKWDPLLRLRWDQCPPPKGNTHLNDHYILVLPLPPCRFNGPFTMLFSTHRLPCLVLSVLAAGLCAQPGVSQDLELPPEHGILGEGCPGPAGTPELTAADGQLPYVGETFTVKVDSLPTDILGNLVFMLGTSKADWAGTALPLDLADLGMPGCTLYISIETYRIVVNVAPTRYWTIFVPADSALIGVRFYQQVLVSDARVNALGGVLSNATESMIGTRG